MHITRRGFSAGAISVAVAGLDGVPAAAQQPPPKLAGALDTITAFAEAHRRHLDCPG